MAKIHSFAEHHGGIQRNVEELAEHFKEYIKGKDIEQAVIVFRSEEDGLCFVAGSESREYSFAEINWDLGQVQCFLLNDCFDNDE